MWSLFVTSNWKEIIICNICNLLDKYQAIMIYRLKYVPGRYFEVIISTLSPSRVHWPLMIFKNHDVMILKPCKIDLLLK
jgi:hypothetical protein